MGITAIPCKSLNVPTGYLEPEVIAVRNIRIFSVGLCCVLFVIVLVPGIFIASASAANVTVEGYIGDTVNLQGESYVGDTVYLFVTGPDLPVNGVTLEDLTSRADQGHFTTVDVENQHWSYHWDTSLIKPAIEPGTYTIYETPQPVDLANLGSGYQTVEVYLQNPYPYTNPQSLGVSINAAPAYTLNPEMHTSTEAPTPTPVLQSPTQTPPPTTVLPPPETKVQAVPTSVSTPAPTQAATLPGTDILAILILAGILQSVKRFR